MNEPSFTGFLKFISDTAPVIGPISFYITYYTAVKQLVYHTFKLSKVVGPKNYSGWIIDSRSLRNIRSVAELQRRVDFKKVSNLIPYIEKIKQYTGPQNMKAAYRNLATLIVTKNSIIDILTLTPGSYEVKKNRINCLSKKSMGHELLHMASSFYDKIKKIEYCGFSQRHKLKTIGDGLNEGYTELLASRIFSEDKKPTSYHRLVSIARLFEYFFDDPKKMEEYYFNHDLPGFIRYMSTFAPKNEIVKILNLMDIMRIRSVVSFDVFPSLEEFKVKMKLYKIFKANYKDRSKIAAFEREIKKSPLINLILSGKKLVLQRDNPYLRVSETRTKRR